MGSVVEWKAERQKNRVAEESGCNRASGSFGEVGSFKACYSLSLRPGKVGRSNITGDRRD